MGSAGKTLIPAFIFLLALTQADPASAADFRLGIGGGASIVVGNFADAYRSGWTTTFRALWLPSSFPLGVRGAAYYGENPAKTSDVPGISTETGALWGIDADVAVRLLGKGADALYVDLGVGSRSLRSETRSPSCGTLKATDANISYNAGAGYSGRWFFVEAGGVFFRVQGKSLVSIPVTFGVQF